MMSRSPVTTYIPFYTTRNYSKDASEFVLINFTRIQQQFSLKHRAQARRFSFDFNLKTDAIKRKGFAFFSRILLDAISISNTN